MENVRKYIYVIKRERERRRRYSLLREREDIGL